MLRLFAVLIAFLIAKSAAQESANFNQTYEGTTKPNGELTIYKYSFPSSNVVRVWIHSENAVTETPVMGVFRERHSIISAQLPFVLQKHTYKSVARILCPFIGNDTTGNDTRSNETMDSLSVEISSGSSTPVDYMINATLIDDFRLQIGERINRSASPSEPSIVRYRFQNDTDSVLVTVDSDDDICMTVTIQSVDECPVFDMESNIFFSGIRQTMIRKAYIPVHHRILKDFYIVFIARPDDRDCIKEKKPSDQSQPRLKKFSVTVENLVNDTSYWLPLSVTVAAIVTVYVLAFFYMAAVAKIERNDWLNHGKAIVEEAARAGEDNNAATHLHEGEENVEDNQEASEIAAEGSNVE
uniref:Uncharacterized protein n=1 Tax=Plectus sambesii TaxID=2011161 RepID=A0A914WD66_9BILA